MATLPILPNIKTDIYFNIIEYYFKNMEYDKTAIDIGVNPHVDESWDIIKPLCKENFEKSLKESDTILEQSIIGDLFKLKDSFIKELESGRLSYEFKNTMKIFDIWDSPCMLINKLDDVNRLVLLFAPKKRIYFTCSKPCFIECFEPI